jgi:signal transduction histidine kinase
MSRRLARAIAGGIVILSLVSVAVSIPIGLAARQRIEPGQIVIVGDPTAPRMQETLRERQREARAGDLEGTTSEYNPFFAVLLLFLLLWLGVGFLIVWRQPTNWAGWIFLITGAPFPLLTLWQILVVYGVKADPGSVPFLGVWATLGEYALYPIALLPLLFLLYPDGHPPSRRWRWAVIGLVGGAAVAILGFLFRPGPFNGWLEDGILYENPLGVDAMAQIGPVVIAVGTVIALLSALSTVIAVRQRFKRAAGEERQQMRWLAFVASLAGAFFALQWIIGIAAELFFRDEDAPVFELFFAFTAITIVVGVPTSYLVAIFRHGLWELDLVLKKTVQYGIVLASFTVVLGLVVLILPVLFVGVGEDVLPAFVLALALTVGFLLVRPRAQRLANRIVYGKRSSPYEVLSAFSERVGETYSTEDVLPRMAQLLASATGARVVRVWLRIGGRMRLEAAWPEDVSPQADVPMQADALPDLPGDEAFEVRHQGELLGALTMTLAPDDPMNPTKERLARDMASQAGLVLRNVLLIEDLRESRRRIVSAQDERARALERNIHDGAQQQLVALAVQLRLAESMVDRDPAKARDLLAQLQSRAAETLEDLRDLARGIYPPLLADKGLPAALEAQARKSPVPVTVQPDGIGRYKPDVEAAVYFSCLEALNNVAKYADASAVEIRLADTNGELRFEVIDDGRGFDLGSRSYGTGLQGIADRLEAIGGGMEVRSAPGNGTTLVGSIRLVQGAPA